MKLTLAEPKLLKESINIISDLVSEARFKINKDCVELVAMDPANVTMIIFKMLSSSFTEYSVNKEVNIAINLGNLKSIMRRASPNDIMHLEVGDENKLKIQLKGNSIRTFYLPLIDLEEKEQKVPELKFPVSIKTSASLLSGAIEDADVVGESVSFIADSKKLIINAEGDLSQASIEIKADDNTKIKYESSDKIKSKYSIEYLKKMINGSKISDTVEIYFNNDYPLKIEYKVVDKVMLAFILAPRVEND